MASNEPGQVLLNSFLDAAGGTWGGAVLSDDFQTVISWAFNGGQATPVANTSAQRATAGSDSGTLWKVVSTVFDNAAGLVPFAKAVFGLFSGDQTEAAPTPIRYVPPPVLNFEAANGPEGTIFGVDYDEAGLPRINGSLPGQQPAATWRQVTDGSAGNDRSAPRDGSSYVDDSRSDATPPQITIQVQAIDSKSFLDHKEEIAGAVREAMLSMHSLNDVVDEL